MAVRDLIPWSRQENRLPAPVSGEREPGTHPLLSLHREMNRLFDDVFRGFGVPSIASFDRGLGWPQLELAEIDKEVRVTAELPGLDEKDIDIQVEDGVLMIRGEKKAEVQDKERGYSERSYGRFERRIGLPRGVDRDKASATFRKGVLTVALPRTEAANENVRRIPTMMRPLEDMARDLRPGPVRYEARPEPAANDNGAPGPDPSSALPADALAIIEPTPIATNQSGRARCGQ